MTLFLKREDLVARIADTRYHRVEGTTATVCTVILHSGFVVIGKSACIIPDIFDEAKGREFAYEDALKNLLDLEAYRVKENAHDAQEKES